MSAYAHSAALQVAIYEHLSTDPAIAAPVYDAQPSGTVPPLYVALGPEQVSDVSDGSGAGTRHDFTVSVVTSQPGFAAAKTMAAHVSQALAAPDITLSSGHLTGIWFRKARAYRDMKSTARRVDLTFRARIDD